MLVLTCKYLIATHLNGPDRKFSVHPENQLPVRQSVNPHVLIFIYIYQIIRISLNMKICPCNRVLKTDGC